MKNAQDKIEENHDAIQDKKEELKGEYKMWADDAAEKVDAAGKAASEYIDGAYEKVKSDTAKAADDMNKAFNNPKDPLESVPVRSRESSIPPYQPKEYYRENPYDPVSDDNSRSLDDVLEPVNNAVKGTIVDDENGEKKNNTLLWIILAIVAVLVIAGCCVFGALFGLIGAIVSM